MEDIIKNTFIVPSLILWLDLHFLWCQAQNHLALISQFSNPCPTAEKVTQDCVQHSLCYCVNCLVLWTNWKFYHFWSNLDCSKSAEWEVVTDSSHEARILPSAVGRTCPAETVLLVTVSAYKWNPSAREVYSSLDMVTLGETIGKTVNVETASGYFRRRRYKPKGTLIRNDGHIARWYKVIWKETVKTLPTGRHFHCNLNIKYVES